MNVNEVKTFAKENNVGHIECFGEESINVELAFNLIVKDILKNRDEGEYFDSNVTA